MSAARKSHACRPVLVVNGVGLCADCGKPVTGVLQDRGPRTARSLSLIYLRVHYGKSVDRFWSRVTKRPDGCWEWTGARTERGYGAVATKRGAAGKYERTMAHRFAWTLEHGFLRGGADLLHDCDHPWCVRPDHLRLGNQVDNNRDMYARGRANPYGNRERHPKPAAKAGAR